MAVVGLAVAVGVAPAAGARASYGAHATGDEPQYLMTAISLGEDGDLDIADERAEGRWEPFHERGAPPVQTEELEGGRRVSPHDPLLPALLALPVLVGGWFATKLALAAMAGALAATLVWVAVRRFGISLPTAAGAAVLAGLSAPLGVYGTQVYPELPAALALLLGIAAVTGRSTGRSAALLGASVVVLPWLGVKYVPVAAALAALGLWRMARGGQRSLALATAGSLAVAGLAYAAAHQVLYGGWTVYATGDHFVGGELTVVGTSPNLWGRAARLAGLLVDRGFGLAVWQPASLVAVPALGALVRWRPPGWSALALPLAAGWLTATFAALTMHGWWWPGRQVVVVLPALVLALAWWADRSRPRRLLTAGLGALGVATFAWLTVEGLAGHLTLVVDFETTANPLVVAARTVLPDYQDPGTRTWALHGLWVAVLTALLAWGARTAGGAPRSTEAPGNEAPGSGAPVPEDARRTART